MNDTYWAWTYGAGSKTAARLTRACCESLYQPTQINCLHEVIFLLKSPKQWNSEVYLMQMKNINLPCLAVEAWSGVAHPALVKFDLRLVSHGSDLSDVPSFSPLVLPVKCQFPWPVSPPVGECLDLISKSNSPQSSLTFCLFIFM